MIRFPPFTLRSPNPSKRLAIDTRLRHLDHGRARSKTRPRNQKFSTPIQQRLICFRPCIARWLCPIQRLQSRLLRMPQSWRRSTRP